MRPAAPNPAVLAKTPLFAGLPFEELSRLAALMHHRSFPARSSVITSGQPGEAVYVILEGSVKVSTIRPHGTEVIFAVLGAGEVVGEMSLAYSLGRSANVGTLEQTTLLSMDRSAFQASARGMPVLDDNLAKLLSRHLRFANARTWALAAMDVTGSVAAQLLALAREYGEPSPEGGTSYLRAPGARPAYICGLRVSDDPPATRPNEDRRTETGCRVSNDSTGALDSKESVLISS